MCCSVNTEQCRLKSHNESIFCLFIESAAVSTSRSTLNAQRPQRSPRCITLRYRQNKYDFIIRQNHLFDFPNKFHVKANTTFTAYIYCFVIIYALNLQKQTLFKEQCAEEFLVSYIIAIFYIM